MMPGETHSKTAGIASEAAGSCQNCTSLQQNLNEYVAALIALKQKIIDSDHLLAEYQQKCDDLQYAERANETLRCQLEQMLQKISPQEQNEEELKSLRAELEEKTSTLKIYQQTQLEYVKVKEECERSDITKKKLEVKLKKMEEAATKHVKDFKKLQLEKKVLEKELKKIQKRLDGFQKEKSKKAMKNAQTQVANKEPVVMLDKQKIKFLLEELWGCIDSSTEKSDTGHLMFETYVRKERSYTHTAECTLPSSHSSTEISSQNFNTLSELAFVQVSHDSTKCTKSKGKPTPETAVAGCNGASVFYEDTTTDLLVPRDLSDGNSVNSNLENEMEEVQQVMNWVKPLPRLLSPLELSPLTTKQVFGEFTDSSDVESCDGSSEIVANNAMDSATLNKNLVCVQEQSNSISHIQTGDVLENVTKQYNGSNEQSDSVAVTTDEFTYHITKGSTSKDDLCTTTEMKTNLQAIEPTILENEVSFGLVSNTLSVFKEVMTEHNQMEHEDTSHHPVNRRDSSEELSLLQTNVDLFPGKLDDLHEHNLEKPVLSEGPTTEIINVANFNIPLDAENKPGDFVNKLEIDTMQCSEDDSSSKTDLTAICSPSVNTNKTDGPKDLTIDGNSHTLASNDHESDRTGDLHVPNSLTADENKLSSMEDSSVTVPDGDQESLQPINSEKCENSSLLITVNTQENVTNDTCLSPFEDTTGADCNQSENCFENVHSVNSVICSSMGTEYNLEQLGSLPVLHLSYTHTQESKQHITHPENTNTQSIPKPPVSSGQGAHLLCNCDHHLPAVSNSDAHDRNCIDIKQSTSPSTSHKCKDNLQKPNENSHELDVNVDKQKILSASLSNKDSICFASEELECGRKKDCDLEKGLNQNEKLLETKYDAQISLNFKSHKTASASKFYSVEEQCKRTLTDTELSSSITSSHKPSASLVDQKAEVRSVQVETTAKIVFCTDGQLSSFMHESSSPSLLHLNDKCGSDIHTAKAEDIYDCPKNHICRDISMSPVANHSKIPVDMDKEDDVENKAEHNHMENDDPSHYPVHIRDSSEEPSVGQSNLNSSLGKVSNMNDQELKKTYSKESTTELRNVANCQEVTLNKDPCIQLDSGVSKKKSAAQCLLSNTELIPLRENQFKVMPDIPLVELQPLHIPSESSSGLKKQTKETANVCDASFDSSEAEDDFLVRKVSYSRTASCSPAIAEFCKTNSKDINKCNDGGHLRICDPLVHDECAVQVPSKVDSPNYFNSIKIENDVSVDHLKVNGQALIVESTNDTSTEGNTVERSFDDKSKEVSPAQVSDFFQSGISNAGKNISSSVERECRKILPGKNLIWNFNRPDDVYEHRVVSMTKGQKAHSDRVCAGSEDIVGKGCVNTEKATDSLDLSKKFNDSGFDFQGVRKEIHPRKLSHGGTVLQNAQVGQIVLANADTSTNTDHSPETINKVRSEMGPPLPPLLGPLLATPPRSLRPLSPIMSSSSRSSLPSPLDGFISPLPGTPFPPLMSPLCDGRKRKSPVFTTPSPVEKANRRILSSPLQFCSATPKHALPVPGRLPLSTPGNSTPNVQENSIKILDTMYPELSARARTLNILKGNVQLNRGLPGDCKTVPVSQIIGFKPITSTSTAFIKTGSNLKANSSKDKLTSCAGQQPTSSCAVNKKATNSFSMPKSAKRLRLDSESPFAESIKDSFTIPAKKNFKALKLEGSCQNISYCELLPDVPKDSNVDEEVITNALKKVEDLCFDLLPVIRSHVHVGTIPKVPVMRNEEKEVIYEFSSSKKDIADHFLHVLLKKLKAGKRLLDSACLQALCRVYVGLCRQLGDIERARILCYSILKEDFPEPDKLFLFIISSWNDLLSMHGVISKAIQAVLKSLTKEEVGPCLSAYLNWEKTPPMNVNVILSSVLMAIQLYPDVKFCQTEKYGEDLTDNIWEYVFAVDLLCNHCKWIWTHDNVISKELWPILDKWVKRKKGNVNIPFVPDIIVATVLRLVGLLCQMGLKEGFVTAVKNIGSVIIAFIQHANEEGMPWGVQLASVYMLCDLAPSDPAVIHQALQTWKETAKKIIPPAVESCMQEVASILSIQCG
ncbi:little elongation complex subunit 1 [Mixophyes fleayi]|uniref:little elongation complex subunit 1 n=1 Tax=Mixophyes fleayi TaxID=3061075 RepID=UPI003F4E0FFF